MKLNKILEYINALVSNNSSFRLNYSKLEFYMDKAVDHINQSLLENYRTISEYFEDGKLYFSVLKYISQHSSNCIYGGFVSDTPNGDCPYFYNSTKKKLYSCADFDPNDKERVFDEVYVPSSPSNAYTVYYYVPNLDVFVTYEAYSNEFSELTADGAGCEIYDSVTELGLEYFDYAEFPDRYIRSCLIYYTAAAYLEEEDETENQYRVFKEKADEELGTWRKEHYSCYDTSDFLIPWGW